MRSTVWEGGGVLPKKKRFWQTPLTIAAVKGVVIIFFKNTVNTVKILLLKLIVLYVYKVVGQKKTANKVFSNLI